MTGVWTCIGDVADDGGVVTIISDFGEGTSAVLK
jgi:hypothetical protein